MSRNDDIIEIQQLLAKYAVTMTKGDTEGVVSVFTPDGTYSAFGESYGVEQFPTLVGAAPKGLFMVGTPYVEFTGDDAATGAQTLHFVDHTHQDVRIGYYDDTYLRTDQGWRLHTRAMTFIRRNGEHNSGRPHAVSLNAE